MTTAVNMNKEQIEHACIRMACISVLKHWHYMPQVKVEKQSSNRGSLPILNVTHPLDRIVNEQSKLNSRLSAETGM